MVWFDSWINVEWGQMRNAHALEEKNAHMKLTQKQLKFLIIGLFNQCSALNYCSVAYTRFIIRSFVHATHIYKLEIIIFSTFCITVPMGIQSLFTVHTSTSEIDMNEWSEDEMKKKIRHRDERRLTTIIKLVGKQYFWSYFVK